MDMNTLEKFAEKKDFEKTDCIQIPIKQRMHYTISYTNRHNIVTAIKNMWLLYWIDRKMEFLFL